MVVVAHLCLCHLTLFADLQNLSWHQHLWMQLGCVFAGLFQQLCCDGVLQGQDRFRNEVGSTVEARCGTQGVLSTTSDGYGRLGRSQ